MESCNFAQTLQLEVSIFESHDSQNRPKLNLKPFSANPTKWSNTIKQFVVKLLTSCWSVFDHFVGLWLKGLK